jgi:hypothetical protein
MQPKANSTTSETQAAASADTGTPRPPRSDRRKRNIPVATDHRHQKPVTSGDGDAATRDRRKGDIPAAVDSRKQESAEAAAPKPAPFVSEEEAAFKQAMDRYKRENRRPFPTWSEVLEVLRSLGYRKVAEESELSGGAPVKG